MVTAASLTSTWASSQVTGASLMVTAADLELTTADPRIVAADRGGDAAGSSTVVAPHGPANPAARLAGTPHPLHGAYRIGVGRGGARLCNAPTPC